ncbi:major facilitator superfamily domain-containing protein [Microdochium trichocladiopsis]|uniref:Major facilitator superfamily domain-containing protein n=1 Tax=Microdochium trichocladiopsis TaxID=1682393 RepID=A0A9P8XY18_9PEZI|nr:major facilitator superfamily domain-containing protein [Microdochium trichocladiopsis]KAH7024665.1 major facilitator superfamily domain-containing protein [Microdochium trichocladiopsis]
MSGSHGETSPLLENAIRSEDSASAQGSPPALHREPSTGPPRGIIDVATVLLIMSVSSFLSFAADTVILEDIICRKYYRDQGGFTKLPERSCKVAPVQSQVAIINGWRSVAETLPALALAVPFGVLADSVGRKQVLVLALVGLFMNDLSVRIVYWFGDILPMQLVWLGAIGAGAITLQSLAFVMVAELCPPEQRVAAFSLIQSSQLLAQFIFVPVGGFLTSVNPWLPMAFSSANSVAAIPAAFALLPDTGKRQNATENSTMDPDSLDEPHEGREAHSQHTADDDELSWLVKQMCALMACTRWVADNRKTVLVLACFFVFSFGTSSRDGSLFLQYASARLGWGLGQASVFVSLGAATNLVIHAIGVPALSTYLLERRRLTEMVKDKYLAQWSGLALMIGTLVISQASSATVLAMGQIVASCGLAFTITARSLITSMTSREHMATLYTFIAVLDYAGMLTGGPSSAALFDAGEAWLGLPYLVSSLSFALALGSITMAP